MFHQKQKGSYCRCHAINNLMGRELISYDEFSTKRMFKSTDHQSNTLIGGDTINFYAYFTDPAGNSNSFTNTTDGSSIIFDRIPPKLDFQTIRRATRRICF